MICILRTKFLFYIIVKSYKVRIGVKSAKVGGLDPSPQTSTKRYGLFYIAVNPRKSTTKLRKINITSQRGL